MDEWPDEIVRKWDDQKITNPFTLRKVTINSTTFRQVDEYIQLHNSDNLLSGLSWHNNSCYMDSVLMCLLTRPSSWTKRYILCKSHTDPFKIALSQELNYLYRKIHSNFQTYDCQGLRQIIRDYYGDCIFASGEQADADEFLRYIFNAFEIGMRATGIVTQDISWGKQKCSDIWEFTSLSIDKRATPIWSIEIFSIINKNAEKTYSITDFMKTRSIDRVNWVSKRRNKKLCYKLRKREVQLVECPFLCVSIPRCNPFCEEKKITTKITPVRHISVKDSKLKLSGIVIHEGSQTSGHYYCFVEFNNNWYLYDDLRDNGRPSLLGGYAFLKELYQDIIAENGVLFFYA